MVPRTYRQRLTKNVPSAFSIVYRHEGQRLLYTVAPGVPLAARFRASGATVNAMRAMRTLLPASPRKAEGERERLARYTAGTSKDAAGPNSHLLRRYVPLLDGSAPIALEAISSVVQHPLLAVTLSWQGIAD